MEKLIDLKSYPVSTVLKLLIQDKATKENIVFATSIYNINGKPISEKEQITMRILENFGNEIIQPRAIKSPKTQAERTRKKAEVFTPSWLCNRMNNYCDLNWFGRENVFNIEHDETWETTTKPIEFNHSKDWQQYIDSTRIEVTCGEAPYIVSRYDTTTAEIIPISNRIGMLDRKLRIVNENTDNEKDWLKWTYRAFQSVYGFELQGDNLLIARINLLITFADYMQAKWNRMPTDTELIKVTDIIVWNFWQMDGLTGTFPFGKQKRCYQMTLFDDMPDIQQTTKGIDCILFDWRNKKSLTYNSMLKMELKNEI